MRPFVLHPAADAELQATIEHYAEVETSLARAFATRYLHYVDRARQNPEHYHIRRNGVRRINLLPKFGERYIAFMVLGEKIVILAIGHAKQKPFYFANRIKESRTMFG